MTIANRLVLSARQAAMVIGCTPCRVRQMATSGQIKATKMESDNNQWGYEWLITRREAERVRDNLPEKRGAPRGGKGTK